MTKSSEDYLEAIYLLSKDGEQAQVRDIAKMLSVKMPSVVKAISELKKLELVTQEPYQPVILTEKGVKIAAQILNCHNLLRSFLIKLGVCEKVADNDACLMEHILSAETLDRIRTYMETGK